MPTPAPEYSLLGGGRRLARAGPHGSARAEFLAIGHDHTTAGIEVRERLAFAHAEIPGVLRRLTDPADRLLGQAAILSTCNRVELYGVAQWRPDEDRLACFLAEYHGIDPSSLAGALYVDRDSQVPHRLAATAAGMRSLMLGEAQIQTFIDWLRRREANRGPDSLPARPAAASAA
jgi:glutamyl-tRNA reductase